MLHTETAPLKTYKTRAISYELAFLRYQSLTAVQKNSNGRHCTVGMKYIINSLFTTSFQRQESKIVFLVLRTAHFLHRNNWNCLAQSRRHLLKSCSPDNAPCLSRQQTNMRSGGFKVLIACSMCVIIDYLKGEVSVYSRLYDRNIKQTLDSLSNSS